MTCLAAGGDVTQTLDVITFSQMITKKFIYIVLMMAASDDLEIRAVHLLNAYVMAPNKDK